MNCPTCGAWSSVLDTRNGPNETVKRRRECANGHRFFTLETHPVAINAATQRANVRANERRRALWRRDQVIRADPRPHKQIASEHGLRREAISRIKRRAKP